MAGPAFIAEKPPLPHPRPSCRFRCQGGRPMRRVRGLWIALGLVGVIALLVALPALLDQRERKIQVYRAFIGAYSEGQRINLANVTTRFDAPNEAVFDC